MLHAALMSQAVAMLGVAVLVALVLFAMHVRGRRRSRRPAPAALPEGWLDLGVLPVPYARRRPPARMLAAYLDPTATHFANAVRHARTRLVLDAVPDGRGVILVDAGACASDAPWVASNLALGLAQLGPVLLVHCDGGAALDGSFTGDEGDAGDAGDAEDAVAEAGAGHVRTWRLGMMDLMRCEPGSAPEAADVCRWRDKYEWIVVGGECVAWRACSAAWRPEGIVRVGLYAGAAQLHALVASIVPDDGAGAATRAVLGVADT